MKKDKSNKECADSISVNELIDHITGNRGCQIKSDLMKMQKNPKVYIVGDNGPEHNSIMSIHWTYAGALKAWDELRTNLLGRAKSHLKEAESYSKKMYEEMVERLSCTDPEKIDNYPQETPYINEYEVEE